VIARETQTKFLSDFEKKKEKKVIVTIPNGLVAVHLTVSLSPTAPA